nr:DEAD/DEAH box helicase [Pseudactinotalea sp. HY160]
MPVEQAERLGASLLEYLATTFNLAEVETQAAFAEFLSDPAAGIFRGPHVRLRLPFAPAPDGWQQSLDVLPAITPYGHQARAFERLSTRRQGGPRPTIVTTGTGSGKTEAFMVPILDHAVRAKARGIRGIKALILYPMNALANDQAARLARDLTTNPAYAGVTAALYTGEASETKRTRVSEAGLITDRRVIRESPPDLLLTNYKMLDQLLLRGDDAPLWRESATSLTYLVIDEFHSYDGAQGTDVAMLLRRLGATLKAHWQQSEPSDEPLTEADWARPLGRITPVATSATLGDEGDPAAILAFAHTVTGEQLEPGAVITETRLSAAEWARGAVAETDRRGYTQVPVDRTLIADVMTDLHAAFADPDPNAGPAPLSIAADPGAGARILLGHLYEDAGGRRPDLAAATPADLLTLVKAHDFTHKLLAATASAVDIRALASQLLPDQRYRPGRRNSPVAFLGAVFSVLSHLRATCGRGAPSVDVHLWVRELSRIDRTIGGEGALFRWGDDGVPAGSEDAVTHAFPALYCRHCGRSGWGVLLAGTGTSLDPTDATIRREHLGRNDRFRALLHAPGEVAAAERGRPLANLRWLDATERRLSIDPPERAAIEAGLAVPVLTQVGEEAGENSTKDVCPSCEAKDAIRFLGSAIATQLSVALGAVFGTAHLSEAEKKALVFTDSVQDASHRAGFVAARSHTLTLRSVMRDHIDSEPTDLTSLTREILSAAGTDARRRYRLLPPALAERERFAPFWQEPTARNAAVRTRIERRLALDIALEFGLRTNVGRTLEATTSVAVGMLIPDGRLISAARAALAETGAEQLLPPDDVTLVRWARAVLAHMRTGGAIAHPWFGKYREHDGNRWFLTGGRAREDGMPWFGLGTSAPTFPYHGGAPAKNADLEPIASRRGWYAGWTAKCLGTGTDSGAHLARALFTELARREVIGTHTSPAGTTTYHLDPATVLVQAATLEHAGEGRLATACDTCGAITRGIPAYTAALAGGPCLVHRCPGRLEPLRQANNFYRRLYATPDPRRIVAREHTSMLPVEDRLAYENQFKSDHPAPDAPNVLVATPTLEMGIDIGDLSTVMLASLPPSTASYVQRVGRAGRLTGNSLAVAFIAARGTQLPAFNHPGRTINGAVRPPVTYLDAEEILRRQYLAFAADALARQGAHRVNRAEDVLRTSAPGSYLGDLIRAAEDLGLPGAFLATLPTLAPDVADRLRHWATPLAAPADSGLAARCHRAVQDWNHQYELFGHRIAEIDAALPELAERAASPAATSEDVTAHRTAMAAKRQAARLRGDLRSAQWISALEEAGLLPNYTLIDDSVTLDVSLSWIDPDTDSFQEDAFSLGRGSERALRDFAPGATFYSRGYAVEVDAIDFSRSRHRIRTWACCAACGHVHDVADGPAPARCPRCDKPEIADIAQRIETVELTHVSSIMRREEAAIDDRSDDRRRTSFTVATLADLDPATAHSWFVEGQGIGVRYARDTTLRWLNLGPTREGGVSATIAGVTASVPLFRICPTCGKLDSASGRNEPRDHRPWCAERKEQNEPTRAVALSRTLRTEALSLRLPIGLTTGDLFAVPSLRAALLLGLEKRLGGAPDHLGLAVVTDPMPGATENPPALLLYDRVPGGTGYLAELAQPAAMWHLLAGAWEALRNCACARGDDARLACEDCLLPYAAPGQVELTSRAAAQRLLRELLDPASAADELPAACPWVTTTEEPGAPDLESYLEQHLRKMLRERLETFGATIGDEPGDRGVSWRITMPGGGRWRLDPQQDLHGSRPDFLLTSADQHVPATAIFADGWRYHASAGHNRLADDAAKRALLREAGYHVLSLAAADLEPGERAVGWFDRGTSEALIAEAQLSPRALGRITRPGLDLLVDWIQDPDELHRSQVAQWLPLMFIASGQREMLPAGAGLAGLALDALTDGSRPEDVLLAAANSGDSGDSGDSAPDHHLAGLLRAGTLTVAAQALDAAGSRSRIAVVLDDRRVGLDHADAWRAWLHLSNLLAFRTDPTLITVASALETDTAAEPAHAPRLDVSHRERLDLTPAWQEALAEATSSERGLLEAMVRYDVSLPAPSIGLEVGDGLPLGPSWPTARLTVDDDYDDETRAEIEELGWRILAAEVGAIQAGLAAAGLSATDTDADLAPRED